MKAKIPFEEFKNKEKQVKWTIEKNDDDTYKAHISFDLDKEITLHNVPGQYVKEDGQIKDPPILDEEGSQKLVDRRIQSFLAQIQQIIFTANFYGGEIDGFISSGVGKEEN